MRILMIAVLALGLVSCGGEEKKTAEKQAYTLDAQKSTLKWKGSKDSSYFHVGSIKVTEGTIEMEGENLVSGTFKIDMNTIVAEDATLPEDKKEMLSAHLKDTAFFFATKFPSVDVNVSGYKDGKLATTINLLGKEIKQEIPVSLAITDEGVELSGKFNLDISSLNMEGLKPSMPEDKPISPVFEFDMNLFLKK
jgi:polyisoprenoid-binding protein YceI